MNNLFRRIGAVITAPTWARLIMLVLFLAGIGACVYFTIIALAARTGGVIL